MSTVASDAQAPGASTPECWHVDPDNRKAVFRPADFALGPDSLSVARAVRAAESLGLEPTGDWETRGLYHYLNLTPITDPLEDD